LISQLNYVPIYFVSILENLTRDKDDKYKRIRGMVHGKGFINPLGENGICWVRDVPKVQCNGYSATSIPCEKFITMSDRLARLAQKYIFRTDIPYEKFLNYPDYIYTPDEKRNEFVYVDNSSVSYENYELIIDIMNGIYDNTKMDVIFISRIFHGILSDMDLGNVKALSLSEYDYGSRYGLLVPAMPNKYYAKICLPRKLLYYLSWGMVPVIHADFLNSERFCRKENLNYMTYTNPKDLSGINLYPSHNKYEYTFEYNYNIIRKKLEGFWGDNYE